MDEVDRLLNSGMNITGNPPVVEVEGIEGDTFNCSFKGVSEVPPEEPTKVEIPEVPTGTSTEIILPVCVNISVGTSNPEEVSRTILSEIERLKPTLNTKVETLGLPVSLDTGKVIPEQVNQSVLFGMEEPKLKKPTKIAYSWKRTIRECGYKPMPIRRDFPKDLTYPYRFFTIYLNVNVASLGKMKLAQATEVISGTYLNRTWEENPIIPHGTSWFLPVRDLTVDLRYPFSKTARVTVSPYLSHKLAPPHPKMTLGYFLWTLAKVYRKVYREKDRWGVWDDNPLESLYFTKLVIEDNVATITVISNQ